MYLFDYHNFDLSVTGELCRQNSRLTYYPGTFANKWKTIFLKTIGKLILKHRFDEIFLTPNIFFANLSVQTTMSKAGTKDSTTRQRVTRLYLYVNLKLLSDESMYLPIQIHRKEISVSWWRFFENYISQQITVDQLITSVGLVVVACVEQ